MMLVGDLIVRVVVHGFPIVAILQKPLLELGARAMALQVCRQVLLDRCREASTLMTSIGSCSSSGPIACGEICSSTNMPARIAPPRRP